MSTLSQIGSRLLLVLQASSALPLSLPNRFAVQRLAVVLTILLKMMSLVTVQVLRHLRFYKIGCLSKTEKTDVHSGIKNKTFLS